MKILIGILILAFTISSDLMAQKEIHPRGTQGRRVISPPRFFPIPIREIEIWEPPRVKVPSTEQPIQLTDMELKVEISGIESETTTTLTFQNPNARVLEGELEFPLPNDAAVTGYALDVNGTMVDGVIVPKEKARVVLETEIRKGVDPGLAEHVKGNLFRTRLYPIPAGGTRKIKIVTVAPLVTVKQDAAMHVALPVGQTIANLSIEVRVNKPPVRPEIGGFGNFSFTDWKDQWVAKANLKNTTPDNDLFINLPKLPDQLVTVENKGEEYFLALSDTPKFDSKAEMKIPSQISIAWDASGSRTSEAVAKDIELLKVLFQAWKNIKVDLVVFRNQPEPLKSFEVKDGNCDELTKHLQSLAYDGATNYELLNFAKKKNSETRWLLFTDGLMTLGNELMKFDGAVINVIASGAARDVGVQKFLANVTGGVFVDLTATDVKHAVDLLVNPAISLLRVESNNSGLADVQSQFNAAANRTNVYARLKSDTVVTLVYGVGSKEIGRTKIQVSKAGATKNDIIARSWAAAYASGLAVFPVQNESELLDLGRKYNLVTPGTSLLVLERLDQYVQYEIPPPESLPQWRADYFAQLKSRMNNKKLGDTSKIERIVNLWNQRVEWWNTDWSKVRTVSEGAYGGASGRESIGLAGTSGDGGGATMREADVGSNLLGAPAAQSLSRSESKGMVAGEPTADRPRLLKSVGSGSEDNLSAISIKEWNPSTPYLTAIQAKSQKEAYDAYLRERKTYRLSPAFYLDCANYFFKFDKSVAIRILSNLAEMKLEDAGMLRVFAWRLVQAEEIDSAIEILEKVSRLRPEDPQSHRDLALALAQRLKRDKKIADGIRAAELFNRVILGEWGGRFDEIETIVVMELNHLLSTMEKIDSGSIKKVQFIDKRLRKLLDLDMRITMSWDADNTDMDLHVIEPSGEEAFYGHPRTRWGGLVSRDITQGYGPEEYVIRKAQPGNYQIRCKYFGSRQQTLMGPVTVTAKVFTNYGRPNEKHQILTLRLTGSNDMIDIGAIAFGNSSDPKNNPAKVSQLSLDKVKALTKGMSQDEVQRNLGAAERQDGSSLKILHYRLVDGAEVQLGFGPNLLWIKKIESGAEISILK